jgi:hypothetical protein
VIGGARLSLAVGFHQLVEANLALARDNCPFASSKLNHKLNPANAKQWPVLSSVKNCSSMLEL